MTTIAASRQVMACDSFASINGVLVRMPKVFALPGRLIGCAGHVPSFMKFITWQQAGGKPTERPDMSTDLDHEWDAIELNADGLFEWDQWLARTPIEEDCYAIGSGGAIAFYCMKILQKTPASAVEEAARIDPYTRGPVRVFQLADCVKPKGRAR